MKQLHTLTTGQLFYIAISGNNLTCALLRHGPANAIFDWDIMQAMRLFDAIADGHELPEINNLRQLRHALDTRIFPFIDEKELP